MNHVKINKFFSALITTSLFCIHVGAANDIPKYLKRNKITKYIEGEVLVKFKEKTTKSASLNSISSFGAKKIKDLDKKGLTKVKLANNQKVEDLLQQMSQDPNVEYAQPNYIYKLLATPNDTNYGQMWGLKNTGQTIVAANGPDAVDSTNNPGTSGKDMNLQEAWDAITDCSSIVVAVIDSGVNYNHNDLAANMWDGGLSYPNHGYDFVDSDNDPMDKNGHGTHVAGTIGAVGNNSTGLVGVCWNSSIMAVRVGDATGASTTAEVVLGINFAVAQNADIINMSLGTTEFDSAFNTAVTAANTSGVLVVVAAGNDAANNDSGSTPTYPCNFTQANVICVAALDQAYDLASFSNYGTTSVDVAAPGVNILSVWPGTHASVADALSSGWSGTTTVSGAGWGYKSLNFGGATNTLVNPVSYDHTVAKYLNNADSRVWKSFSVSAAAAVVHYSIMYDVEQSADYVATFANNVTGDPMASGTALAAFTGTTDGYRESQSHDISNFMSANTTIGFVLLTDASVNDFGTNVSLFSIETLVNNNITYNVIAGTSMASPHVAGLAAMIMAYNPNYTISEVIASVTGGGDSQTVLASKTTSGKSVNALGSLAYIKPPTGLGAVKQ